jgi:hypothetical protein
MGPIRLINLIGLISPDKSHSCRPKRQLNNFIASFEKDASGG